MAQRWGQPAAGSQQGPADRRTSYPHPPAHAQRTADPPATGGRPTAWAGTDTDVRLGLGADGLTGSVAPPTYFHLAAANPRTADPRAAAREIPVR